MKDSSRCRNNRRARSFGLVAGLLAGPIGVWHSTHAMFAATTSNGPNQLATGSVSITDNDGGAAIFTAPTLAPGDSATACLGVEYLGTLAPSAIRLYLTSALESDNGGAYGAWTNSTTSEMDDNVSMRIQVSGNDLATDPGSACAPAGVGSFTDVAAAAPGTNLRTLIGTNTAYASGLPSQWGTVTANKWRVWRFTYTFSASAPNSAQGDGVQFTIVWEAQR